jgi:hypothetical protein
MYRESFFLKIKNTNVKFSISHYLNKDKNQHNKPKINKLNLFNKYEPDQEKNVLSITERNIEGLYYVYINTGDTKYVFNRNNESYFVTFAKNHNNCKNYYYYDNKEFCLTENKNFLENLKLLYYFNGKNFDLLYKCSQQSGFRTYFYYYTVNKVHFKDMHQKGDILHKINQYTLKNDMIDFLWNPREHNIKLIDPIISELCHVYFLLKKLFPRDLAKYIFDFTYKMK